MRIEDNRSVPDWKWDFMEEFDQWKESFNRYKGGISWELGKYSLLISWISQEGKLNTIFNSYAPEVGNVKSFKELLIKTVMDLRYSDIPLDFY